MTLFAKFTRNWSLIKAMLCDCKMCSILRPLTGFINSCPVFSKCIQCKQTQDMVAPMMSGHPHVFLIFFFVLF